VSNLEVHRGSSVFGVDSDLVTMESSEDKVVDATRVRLCHTVLVSEVKALKTEVNLLKRSLDEEKEARKFGDSLSGEAILQLQTILEFEQKQRSVSESKLGQHLEAVMSSEMASLKQTLESRPSQQTSQDIDSINDLRAFRAEVDRDIKSRFERFDRLFEESHHKFEDLCRCVLSKGTHESCMTEIVHGLNEERAERQRMDKTMHELLTSLAEQTNNVLEEETSRLWKALRTHSHPAQALANNVCFTGKSPHIIQWNQGGFTPLLIEDNGALTPSTRVSSQQPSESSLMTPLMSQRSLTPSAKHQ